MGGFSWGLLAAGGGAVIGVLAKACLDGMGRFRRHTDDRLRRLEEDVSRINGRFDGGDFYKNRRRQ